MPVTIEAARAAALAAIDTIRTLNRPAASSDT